MGMSRKLCASMVALALTAPLATAYWKLEPIEIPEYLDLFRGGSGSGSGRSGSGSSSALIEYALNRTLNLDTSNDAAVQNATLDIDDYARQRVLTMADALANASNIAGLVLTAYNQSYGTDSTWEGARTNLDKARSGTGLADAVIALLNDMNEPPDAATELDIRSQAALIPTEANKAAALAVYAAIDARHYADKAFANVDRDAWQRVKGNESLLSMLHRRMLFTEESGNTTLTFDNQTAAVLRDAKQVANSTDIRSLFQALHVLAQATDEILTLNLDTSLLDGREVVSACSDQPVLLAVNKNCRVIIGGTNDATYKEMFSSGQEKNVVLVDFGGSDTYLHAAGGASGPDKSCTDCPYPVQLNIDLGSDQDHYLKDGSPLPDKPLLASQRARGPAHGAGQWGVGFLYDHGGDDVYRATHYHLNKGVIGQGAGRMGAGLLFDRSGNDQYLLYQTQYCSELKCSGSDPATHGQGFGETAGFGLLRDANGDDTYEFRMAYDVAGHDLDGGGGQAYAGPGGIAYLLDAGLGTDTYKAGQDLVQGAASGAGFALLHDEGGTNHFTIEASPGCPKFRDYTCESDVMQPLGGWGQGYADTNGYAAILIGTGADAFSTLEFPNSTTRTFEVEDRIYEGPHTLGSGNTSGAAVFVDLGGGDIYASKANGVGYGEGNGMGVFSDQGGDDAYRCVAQTCHGYADNARAIYYDGVSSGDTYDDGNPRTSGPWTRGNLGLGVHLTGGNTP